MSPRAPVGAGSDSRKPFFDETLDRSCEFPAQPPLPVLVRGFRRGARPDPPVAAPDLDHAGAAARPGQRRGLAVVGGLDLVESGEAEILQMIQTVTRHAVPPESAPV